MEKYEIKEQLNKLIGKYEKQALDKNLVFRIHVDSDMPAELSGDIDSIMDVIYMLIDEAFSHTQDGKIVLEISCADDSVSKQTKFELGTYMPICLAIIDTGNNYDVESDRIKNCKAKLIFLDSNLKIENRDKLGAKVSFVVSQKVESKNIVDAFNYVIKNRIEDVKTNETTDIIKGVDFAKGLAYVQGNQTVYEEFLLEYVKSSSDFRSRLEEYFESKDMVNYRIVAHSIKSNSYYVGANELGDLAKEMEFAARDLEIDFVQKMHDTFRSMYCEIIKNIEEYLTGNGIVVDYQPETDIDKLIFAIDNFDQDKALEILEQIAIAESKKDVIDDIRTKLEDFDYFSASELAKLL